MNVLLIDDHPLFRAGLRLLLADLSDPIEFHECSTAAEAFSLSHPPIDLVLLDLPPAGMRVDVPNLMRQVQSTYFAATIVIVSDDDRANTVRDAISSGAAGFIPKSSTPAVLISALRLVLAGGIYLPPHILQSMGTELASGAGAAADSPDNPPALESEPAAESLETLWLSDRQREVLQLAVTGRSNRRIAADLGISEGTVKQHLSAAYRTLGVRNRTEAVFAAVELNLWRLADGASVDACPPARSATVHRLRVRDDAVDDPERETGDPVTDRPQVRPVD